MYYTLIKAKGQPFSSDLGVFLGDLGVFYSIFKSTITRLCSSVDYFS